MADPNTLDFLRIPFDTLIALDNRTLHFALQPWHHLIRLTHLVTMAAFFGGIGFLDLRLMGRSPDLPIKAYSEHVLPWVYGTFAVTMLTGTLLFLYDPVHVGAHAYFTLKLILILLGMANAAWFNQTGYGEVLTTSAKMTRFARIAGTLSLVLWLGVIVCAALNTEAAPKVLLQ